VPNGNLRVHVETSARIKLLTDLDEVELDANGDGETPVPVGEERILLWIVVGDPGTPYKISLSAREPTLAVKMITGTNPIDTRIATMLFRGSGHVRFKLEPKP
jgi:hypothetical protein